jgi:hypothetical protein
MGLQAIKPVALNVEKIQKKILSGILSRLVFFLLPIFSVQSLETRHLILPLHFLFKLAKGIGDRL